MTVQLLANEDSLLDIQADIDGPGALPPAPTPTTRTCSESLSVRLLAPDRCMLPQQHWCHASRVSLPSCCAYHCARCFRHGCPQHTASQTFSAHDTEAPLSRIAAGTPFEGGVFRMKLVLGPDFPASPPKGKRPERNSTLIATQLHALAVLNTTCWWSQLHNCSL